MERSLPAYTLEIFLTLATIVLAVAAIVSLNVARKSLLKNSRSIDVSSVLEIADKFQKAEKFLRNNKDDKEFEFFVGQHLNFMETIAYLYNNDVFEEHTAYVCKVSLIMHIVELCRHKKFAGIFDKAAPRVESKQDLGIFYKKFKDEIAREQKMVNEVYGLI